MADIPWFQIDQMKKLVFRKSGIYNNIKKIIRCRNCNQWSLTNHVFCPKCCRNPSSVTNWELCRLYVCGSKNCCSTTPIEGNSDPLFFEQLICAHKTRKPCGDYVLYVPIESVIVDYIQCGYLGEIDVTGEVVVRINICSQNGLQTSTKNFLHVCSYVIALFFVFPYFAYVVINTHGGSITNADSLDTIYIVKLHM